ncbi:AMP nucleosidase [Escherichia coli]|uniref:AMP nucleosidase n=1 Tax=Escherichia coli TaxID=562 RepID=A0A376TDI4_ECOLX|nr:AMP nucleosidase [Escherichia coli]
MNNKGSGLTPAQALDKLDALYEQSVVALRQRHWQLYYKWRIT